MQLSSQVQLFTSSPPDVVPLGMVVLPGPCRNDSTRTTQGVLVVDLDDAVLLQLKAPCITSAPSTTDGKWSVDKIQVEVAKQPCIIGLDDPIILHHDAVSRQLFWHHEQQPDLIVKGPGGDGEMYAVMWLD